MVTGRILTIERFSRPSAGGACSRGNIEVELRFDDCARLISEIRGTGSLRSEITEGEVIEKALQEVGIAVEAVKGKK